MSDTADED